MARAGTYTMLSLDRFAALLGIPPAHFNGAAGETYFPDNNACSNIFYQYSWQNGDHVGREDIARTIKDAEDEIAHVLGFSPAPVWVEGEVHEFPRHHRRDVWQVGGLNVRGDRKSVKANYGRFILAGKRATTLVDDAVAVVRSDADGDGFKETVTVTCATSVTDRCELKVYFAGKSAAPEWEIRPARSVALSGGNVTFTFYSWQFIDPDLQEYAPTAAGLSAINLEADASYVETVDVYREYTDTTQPSAVFYWEPEPLTGTGLTHVGICTFCNGIGCAACSLVTQNGCIHVHDVANGIVVPTPATYDSTDARWEQATFGQCRDPDQVKLHYYAGDLSPEYLRGVTCDPLSHYWAEAIAWLATARIHKPFCTCNNTLTLVEEWQRDLSFTGSRLQGSFTISNTDLENPFGTRKGEVMAWKRVSRLAHSVVGGAI